MSARFELLILIKPILPFITKNQHKMSLVTSYSSCNVCEVLRAYVYMCIYVGRRGGGLYLLDVFLFFLVFLDGFGLFHIGPFVFDFLVFSMFFWFLFVFVSVILSCCYSPS